MTATLWPLQKSFPQVTEFILGGREIAWEKQAYMVLEGPNKNTQKCSSKIQE